MRTSYWSHSRLALYLKRRAGFSIPTALSWKDWDLHDEQCKQKSPFIFWLTDEFFNDIQSFVYWPYDKIRNLTYYFKNRFVTKSHMVVTTLKPGKWHESDDLMLHSMMAIMNDFVRNQKAWMRYIWHNSEKFDLPFWKTKWPFRHFCKFDNEKLGLEYLRWEKTLTYDNVFDGVDLAGKPTGQPSGQAIAAKELYTIYHWWNYVRPDRTDVYGEDLEEIKTKYGKDYAKRIFEIEAEFDAEDEEMMVRLIKIRGHLWT